ncbi:unnamed protein product [Phytophthora lilii]|uniref:Unnamed protein product n=1 Tax=Phytophthora lilii TaxID=2077276 RepID=A0A9W6TI78_9STRA|nr:unnamed protein product [Phytophthora lilii]
MSARSTSDTNCSESVAFVKSTNWLLGSSSTCILARLGLKKECERAEPYRKGGTRAETNGNLTITPPLLRRATAAILALARTRLGGGDETETEDEADALQETGWGHSEQAEVKLEQPQDPAEAKDEADEEQQLLEVKDDLTEDAAEATDESGYSEQTQNFAGEADTVIPAKGVRKSDTEELHGEDVAMTEQVDETEVDAEKNTNDEVEGAGENDSASIEVEDDVQCTNSDTKAGPENSIAARAQCGSLNDNHGGSGLNTEPVTFSPADAKRTSTMFDNDDCNAAHVPV